MSEYLEFEISPITEEYVQIFFAENRGHYFKSPQSRGFFRKFLISLALTFIIIVVSFSIVKYNPDVSPSILLLFMMILFCVTQIMTIIFFLGFIQKALEIKRWKKQINEFLEKLKTTKSFKIILSNTSLAIIQDDTEKILNWSGIKEVEINSAYILLVSQEYFLIPSKCLGKENYAKLKEALSKKLKLASADDDNTSDFNG